MSNATNEMQKRLRDFRIKSVRLSVQLDQLIARVDARIAAERKRRREARGY